MIYIPRCQGICTVPEEAAYPSWVAVADQDGGMHVVLCDRGLEFHICGYKISDEGIVAGVAYGKDAVSIALKDWPGWDCLTTKEPLMN